MNPTACLIHPIYRDWGNWADMASLPSSTPVEDRFLGDSQIDESGAGAGGERLLRFGEFEADLQRGVLHRNGIRVDLRGQLMDMLRIFLERPGEVITQEEFRKLLWPEDVHLSFEQGVYTAIKDLREALGDSASRPRYIETRARRGYRLIAPVRVWRAPAVESIEKQPATDPRNEGRIGKWLRGCLCISRGWLAFLLLAALAGLWFLLRLI